VVDEFQVVAAGRGSLHGRIERVAEEQQRGVVCARANPRTSDLIKVQVFARTAAA